MNRFSLSVTATLAVVTLGGHTAVAGPCEAGISEVAKILAMDPSLGPAITGALAGAGPGAIPETAKPDPVTGAGAPSLSPDAATNGTSSGTTSGEGGMKEMNAAANQIATSAQDVRLQQKGQPTVAQGGNAADTDNMGQAKVHLENARALDRKNDQACSGELDQARKLMGS